MKFTNILKDYLRLLEQEGTPLTPNVSVGEVDPNQPPSPNTPNDQIQEVENEPASTVFTYLTKMLAYAFQTTDNKKNIKFSDNFKDISINPIKYAEIILKQLPIEAQRDLQQGDGNVGETNENETKFISPVVNNIVKAFYIPNKLENPEFEEDAAKISTDITPQNAKKEYNNILSMLQKYPEIFKT